MVCYLPLFAAAVAHFSSVAGAAPHAPRFVLLDDAFPKIDVRTHPLLFGLLVDRDLDFLITSESCRNGWRVTNYDSRAISFAAASEFVRLRRGTAGLSGPQAVEGMLGRGVRLSRREPGVVWNQRWTLLPSADCSR